MKKEHKGWTVTFWIVTIICIMQYLLLVFPRLSKIDNIGAGVIIGSLIPNLIIILIFGLIKRSADKKLNRNEES